MKTAVENIVLVVEETVGAAKVTDERMVLPMEEQTSRKKEGCDVWLRWEVWRCAGGLVVRDGSWLFGMEAGCSGWKLVR